MPIDQTFRPGTAFVFCGSTQRMKALFRAGRLVSPLLFLFCNGIDFSLWDIDVPAEEGNNIQRNLSVLAKEESLDLFRVALISDIHVNVDELNNAIDEINKRDDIRFVVFLGDFTNSGLSLEYELVLESICRLKIPYLTVPGNHDLLSNGPFVYERLFGPLNYTFRAGKRGFVAWNNNKWESEADFEWLSAALAEAGPGNVVFAHIPPGDPAFTPSQTANWKALLAFHKTAAFISGHLHHEESWFENGIHYYVAGEIKQYPYRVLDIYPDSLRFEVANIPAHSQSRFFADSLADVHGGFRMDRSRPIRGILRLGCGGCRGVDTIFAKRALGRLYAEPHWGPYSVQSCVENAFYALADRQAKTAVYPSLSGAVVHLQSR